MKQRVYRKPANALQPKSVVSHSNGVSVFDEEAKIEVAPTEASHTYIPNDEVSMNTRNTVMFCTNNLKYKNLKKKKKKETGND